MPGADGEEEADGAADPPADELGLGDADGSADSLAEELGEVLDEADADGVEPPPSPSSSQSVQNTLCLAAPFSPSKFQNSL
ncbi:hypothetical protein SALBM311S_02083 [Streptomyces alboniger]